MLSFVYPFFSFDLVHYVFTKYSSIVKCAVLIVVDALIKKIFFSFFFSSSSFFFFYDSRSGLGVQYEHPVGHYTDF